MAKSMTIYVYSKVVYELTPLLTNNFDCCQPFCEKSVLFKPFANKNKNIFLENNCIKQKLFKIMGESFVVLFSFYSMRKN